MPRGSKPGERRGGRQKGAKNKATLAAEQRHAEAQELADRIRAGITPSNIPTQVVELIQTGVVTEPKPEDPEWDELRAMKDIAKVFFGMAVAEQNKHADPATGKGGPDFARLRGLLLDAGQVLAKILPYTHRPKGAPAKGDGSHVPINEHGEREPLDLSALTDEQLATLDAIYAVINPGQSLAGPVAGSHSSGTRPPPH